MLGAIEEGNRSINDGISRISQRKHDDGLANDEGIDAVGDDNASSDNEEYQSRHGIGTLGRRSTLPTRWERLGMSLRRMFMDTILNRLGDRVVDLREAYQSLNANKSEDYGGQTGSRVRCGGRDRKKK